MKTMKEDEWNSMTKAEQVEHLQQAEIVTERKQFANANDPVGDVGVQTRYRAFAGGVAVSGYEETEAQAEAAAERVISEFAKEANDE